MTDKFTLELEGEAYQDGVAIANKFLELIVDRLSKIETLVENNGAAIDNLSEAIHPREKARDTLDGK